MRTGDPRSQSSRHFVSSQSGTAGRRSPSTPQPPQGLQGPRSPTRARLHTRALPPALREPGRSGRARGAALTACRMPTIEPAARANSTVCDRGAEPPPGRAQSSTSPAQSSPPLSRQPASPSHRFGRRRAGKRSRSANQGPLRRSAAATHFARPPPLAPPLRPFYTSLART